MALPANGVAWPPKSFAPIAKKQAEFDAWYSGDPAKLGDVYRTGADTPVFDRTSQLRGGVVGTLARMWWGKPAGNLFERNSLSDKLHIPFASDLCQASADLLFAEPPTLKSQDKKVAEELDKALEQGILNVFAEGNEVGAALGDVYYRVTWDRELRDRTFIVPIHADAAYPEFRWGLMTAVTFSWKLEERDGGVVIRHLERHELVAGTGVVFHGLYEGTADNLGRAVPLNEHPSTAGLLTEVDAQSMITTQTPGLAVVHVPNQTPNRVWRQHPVGRNLGRSDLAGIEPELDKLDMVWSSWMRDIRLAKSRLIVPSFMLSSNGPGQGAMFDTDQDVFTTLNAPPREDGKSEITPQQFDIRVADHQATADALIKVMMRTAGYGPQTFGEQGEAAQTATEVDARDARSNRTRDRKIRCTESPMKAIIRKKLAMDQIFFKTGVTMNDDTDLVVAFPDSTQANPADLAQTNSLLFAAQSASVQTRVKIQHPDWDDKAVQAEAALILEQFGSTVPDPVGFNPGTEKTNEELAAEEERAAAEEAAQ